MACGQLFQQCGVGQVVCHACLLSCPSLLPAPFAAPVLAALACPVRWLQHVTAPQTYLHEAQVHNLILDPQMCVCVCLLACVCVCLSHIYFVKFARIVTLYNLDLLKSSLKGF